MSKHVSVLEGWLGRPLFAKNRKTMRPTDEAQLLADAADKAWDLIASAVENLRHEEAGTDLAVIAPSTFAMRWLIPRLWGFASEHASINVQLRQTHTLERWHDIPFDVAIRPEEECPPHLVSRIFLQERLGLAIAPSAADARRIAQPSDLAGVRLLRASTRPGELEAWLAAAGLDPSLAAGAAVFPHFYLALEAALAGTGALVCPLETVSELIYKVELKEPLPRIRIGGPRYAAMYDPGSRNAAAAAKLVDWLCGLAGQAPGDAGQIRVGAVRGEAGRAYI